jgi:hypothetical protein
MPNGPLANLVIIVFVGTLSAAPRVGEVHRLTDTAISRRPPRKPFPKTSNQGVVVSILVALSNSEEGCKCLRNDYGIAPEVVEFGGNQGIRAAQVTCLMRLIVERPRNPPPDAGPNVPDVVATP